MKEDKSFEMLCLWYHPSQQEIASAKLTTVKYKNKMRKLFKIKNEDTRTISMASL